MRKLLEYEATGEWPGKDMSYENSVVVRSNGTTELVFRSLIRDEDGDALYSQSINKEIDNSVYEGWIENLEISNHDFDEVNHESNLGPERDQNDLEDLMPSRSRRRYESSGSNNHSSRLWIREGEASDEEVEIRWEGLSPHGVYQDVIGSDTVPVNDWREASEWESSLPQGLIEDMPQRSYEMYNKLGIEEMASKKGVSPVEVFQEFYSGETDQDEYLVISGADSDVTLANPWPRQIAEAAEAVEVEDIQHLHEGSVERYGPEELDQVIQEFSGSREATESRREKAGRQDEDTIFGILDLDEDLASVNGAMMFSDDREDIDMRTSEEVRNLV